MIILFPQTVILFFNWTENPNCYIILKYGNVWKRKHLS